MKYKRNEPCPCGSGQKFKKCCLGESSAINGNVEMMWREAYRAGLVDRDFDPDRYQAIKQAMQQLGYLDQAGHPTDSLEEEFKKFETNPEQISNKNSTCAKSEIC